MDKEARQALIEAPKLVSDHECESVLREIWRTTNENIHGMGQSQARVMALIMGFEKLVQKQN